MSARIIQFPGAAERARVTVDDDLAAVVARWDAVVAAALVEAMAVRTESSSRAPLGTDGAEGLNEID